MRPRFLTVLVALTALVALACAPSALAQSPGSAARATLAGLALQQTKLTGSDGATEDFFGYAVAIDGDTALVGACGRTVGDDANVGVVYVFVRSGATWSQQTQLSLADGGSGDVFGSSVAIDGDTALVGAPGRTFGENNAQGAVYVFVRSGATWDQQAELTVGDGASYDAFGSSVALSGDTALIGAPNRAVGGNDCQGTAYVFTRSGATWSQQGDALTASAGAVDDHFGYAVALSGDTALVGAPGPIFGGPAGAAYVFTCSGGVWSQQAGALTADDGSAGDYFGSSVAIDGDTALIGASCHKVGENDGQGAAYVFTCSGGVWSRQTELTAGDGAEWDAFGTSVALDGDCVLIGAPGHTVGDNDCQGGAYVFTRSGATWSQQGDVIAAADGASWDAFGCAVALSGGTGLVGADYRTVGGNDYQGAAYVLTPSSDSTAPVTVATGLVAGPISGWTTSAATVTLDASDEQGGSGVASLHYAIDGGAEQTVDGSSASFTVSGDGSHAITYWAVDVAGNTEAASTGYVNIDAGAPRLRLASDSLRLSLRSGARLVVRLRWNDAASRSATLRALVTQYGTKMQRRCTLTLAHRGSWQTLTLPWRPRTPGRYSLHLVLIDHGGHKTRASALVTVGR